MTDASVLIRLALLLVRPGVVVALAPTIGGAFVPPHIKVGLTVLLGIGLLPAVTLPDVTSLGPLTTVIAREVVIGMSIALMLRALVAGVEFAGHLSGLQMGLGYAATIDPANGVRNSVITSLFGMTAVLALFAINGHHAMLRALAMSYSGLPMGTGGVDDSLLQSVRDTFALVFVTGVRLAAPLIVVLVIVETAIGFISRVAPSLSFMVIGYPIRLVIGLFVIGLVVGTIPGAVSGLLDRTLRLSLAAAAAFK